VHALRRRGLTVEQIARAVGVDKATVSRLGTGTATSVSRELDLRLRALVRR